MATVKGQYSKGIDGGYDENERLLFGLVRPGIPWVDGDENMSAFAQFTWMRRALQTVIGNASPNNGFRCIGDSASNDFLLEGGDGTLTGAGRMWVSGMHCFLTSDIRSINVAATTDDASIYPEISFITGLTNQILEDPAADYIINSLVGRTITPDVTAPAVTAIILANDARTITTDSDLIAGGALPGDQYRIEMRTPVGGGRDDGVYLNVALDEIDGTELPTITHSLGTQVTAQFFTRVRCVLEIHENDSVGLPGALSENYIDADGLEHFRIKIADITRFDGQDAIDAPDVADLRVTSANFSTFVRKIGDTMVGDLILDGADIVMLAGETVDGRDVSVDGTKLDNVDFTPQGIADQLPLVSWPVQGTDLTGVTTQTIPVGFALRTKEPGATDVIKGVFTAPPENDVRIQKVGDLDDFTAGTDDAQKVFGRITESHPFPNISGTWTFTIATFSVTGVGGAALTELNSGDLVRGPDNLFYTVNAVTTDDAFTTIEPFGGGTAATVSPDARRWILAFVINDEGSETPVTPGAGPGFPTPSNIRWHYEEVFDAADRPVRNPFYGVPSDQVAAEVPDGSESTKGKVVFGPSKNTDALKAVQGSDSRLLGPNAIENASSIVPANHGPLRMIEGAGATITYAFVGGEHQFTVATSATPFPPLSTTNADLKPAVGSVGAGSVGSSGEVVHSDHVHPRSTSGDARDGLEIVTAGVTTAVTFQTAVLTMRPRLVLVAGKGVGLTASVGYGSSVGNQAYANNQSGADALVSGSIAGHFNGTEGFALFGAFSRGNVVTFQRVGAGPQIFNLVYAVLGDNADL